MLARLRAGSHRRFKRPPAQSGWGPTQSGAACLSRLAAPHAAEATGRLVTHPSPLVETAIIMHYAETIEEPV